MLIKVKQYNQLISSFQLLADLNRFSKYKSPEHLHETKIPADNRWSASSIKSITELQAALNLTKHGILKSIELENYLYSHRDAGSSTAFPHNPAQLLADLENNLAAIISSEIERDLEYQQLLNEAIELGTSLHQEIQQFWTRRRGD